MKKTLYITLGILITLGVSVHASVTNPFHIWEGGTGTSTAPTYGKTLVGDANGNYEYIATSTFGGGGGGSGTVTSITASSPLTGGVITTSGSIGCTTADASHTGCLTSTDWNTFNGKQASGSYLTTIGSGTSGQLSYWTGTNTLTGVSTSTLSASSPLTGSFTQVGSGGALGIQVANTSQGGYLSSTDWNTFNNKQASGAYLTGVTADSPLSGAGTSASHLTISTSGTWSGNAGTATALAANGTNCSAGSYALGVDASGNAEGCTVATVGTVTSIGLSDSNSTLTIGSTPVTTSGTITATLNLGHTNTWSVLQNFNYSSSTAYSTFQTASTTLGLFGKVGVGTSTPAVAVDVNGSIVSEESPVSFSATPTFDWSTSNQIEMTLTANVTSMTFSNGQRGGGYRLVLCNGTGGYTVVWPTNVLWTNSATPTMTTTANKCDLYTFTATYATTTALEYFGGYVQNF